MTGEDLTVVIPTRERWDILSRTLESLDRQSVRGFETVVVCDGADQQVPDWVRLGEDVRVLEGERAGPGAARNLGVERSRRPLLLFLGDDMLASRRLVERHLDRHSAEPSREVAVLGRVRWHPEVTRGRVMRWLEWSDAQFDYRVLERQGVADAGFGRFYASNVSLKRELFAAAGGFDPAFSTADYEDLDLGWRLHRQGLKLRYEPEAVTYHLHRHDLTSIERRYELRGAAERRMAAKHDWFAPWFYNRIRWHAGAPRVSRAWPVLVDLVPARPRRLRAWVEQNADRWYHQLVAQRFLIGWEAEREAEELREYLGDRYDHAKLVNWLSVVDEELERAGDEALLYRTSEMYLYNLTAFAMTGTKEPYRQLIQSLLPAGSRVLDYGCGIGSDGLRLLEAGYRVAFADFDNPSTRYLRWRLARRGLEAETYDLDREVPGGFDAVFAFDVIEHVDDPFGLLAELERRGSMVVVNLLEAASNDTTLHRALPIDELLERARGAGMLRHEIHGRAHLVAYRGERSHREHAPGPLRALRQRAAGSARS